LCSTLWDEQNYVSFAYVLKKLTYYCFNSSLSFCSSWIYRVNLTGVISSISSLRCRLSSGWRRQAATPCHTSFPSSQDELTTSASSSGDASSCRLPSRAETEVLNLHHRHWPPSSAIKKSSQPCHSPHHSIVSPFYLLLARASCHQSFTRHRCSLSPSSYAHHPSTQRYPHDELDDPLSLLK
jgi:hypothetical protein